MNRRDSELVVLVAIFSLRDNAQVDAGSHSTLYLTRKRNHRDGK